MGLWDALSGTPIYRRFLLAAAERRSYMGQRGLRSRCLDPDVRRFLVTAFEQIKTTDEAVAEARAKFGSRAPSRSAIGRFFKYLRDELRAAAREAAG